MLPPPPSQRTTTHASGIGRFVASSSTCPEIGPLETPVAQLAMAPRAAHVIEIIAVRTEVRRFMLFHPSSYPCFMSSHRFDAPDTVLPEQKVHGDELWSVATVLQHKVFCDSRPNDALLELPGQIRDGWKRAR